VLKTDEYSLLMFSRKPKVADMLHNYIWFKCRLKFYFQEAAANTSKKKKTPPGENDGHSNGDGKGLIESTSREKEKVLSQG